MSTLRHPVSLLARFALVGGLFAAPAYADQLVYVPLSQPCRLLDTRGSGVLTAASGSHLFGTSKIDIVAQHGNPEGCAIPAGVQAVSVNMNMLNATAPGNISTWSASAGPTAPNIGTAVYNPTVGSPSPGQVQYNTGYTSVPLGAAGGSNGRFYLQVANGQIDMTINAVGYWLPISISEIRSGAGAVALGLQTTASGFISTAMGENTTASGNYSTALGGGTTASGYMSTAMGVNTTASGSISTAMGASTTASGDYSTAMGDATVASGLLSTAMGSAVDTAGHKGSFIYGDSVHSGTVGNSHDDQFTVVAEGGVQFFTGEDPVSHALAHGVELAPGGGSWTTISDRNAKTAVQPVDAREVLKKVAALPLNTWQYKTQESKYRHMGPMAQDFYAAFQLGETDKGIDTVDADGVALAAIQGLNELLAEKDAKTAARLDEKEREIVALRDEKDREIVALREELSAQKTQSAAQQKAIAAQSEEIQGQKSRLASLESLAGEFAEMKSQLAALRRSSPNTRRVRFAAVENDCCSEGKWCRLSDSNR